MPIVTTTCNQCEQGEHLRCPAAKMFAGGFTDNPGDHCACAAEKHTKIPQSNKESPKLKSMLGKQNEVRDIPKDTREVVEEQEADSIEGADD